MFCFFFFSFSPTIAATVEKPIDVILVILTAELQLRDCNFLCSVQWSRTHRRGQLNEHYLLHVILTLLKIQISFESKRRRISRLTGVSCKIRLLTGFLLGNFVVNYTHEEGPKRLSGKQIFSTLRPCIKIETQRLGKILKVDDWHPLLRFSSLQVNGKLTLETWKYC